MQYPLTHPESFGPDRKGHLNNLDIDGSLTMGSSGNSEIKSDNYNGSSGYRIWTDKSGNGHMVYSAMGGTWTINSLKAGYNNNDVAPSSYDSWKEHTSVSGPHNTDHSKSIKQRLNYVGKEGINHLIISGNVTFTKTKPDAASLATGSIIATIGSNTKKQTFTSSGYLTLKLPLNLISEGAIHELKIELEVNVQASASGDLTVATIELEDSLAFQESTETS